MIINLSEKPKIIKSEKNMAVFEIEGLDPGYGTTLGNAMRRVLFSSISGAAATSIKIKNVAHEFSTLPHIKEDIIEIALNVKQVRFKLQGDESQVVFLKASGKKNITAKDIKVSSQVEVVNKEIHIAELTNKAANLDMEIIIEKGLGYIPVEDRKGAREKLPIGTIALDAIFTPIRKVNFEVENMRVGERTDYNRLKIIIETDSTINPGEAFLKASNILLEQFSRLAEFGKKDAVKKEKIEKEDEAEAMIKEDVEKKEMKSRVSELDIPERVKNSLEEAGVKTINQLSKKSEADLLETPGLGEKGVKEIKRELGKLGLNLKSE